MKLILGLYVATIILSCSSSHAQYLHLTFDAEGSGSAYYVGNSEFLLNEISTNTQWSKVSDLQIQYSKVSADLLHALSKFKISNLILGEAPGGVEMKADAFDTLKEFKNLKSISICSCAIKNENLAFLKHKNLLTLERFTIEGNNLCLGNVQHGLSDDALPMLMCVANLKYLSIRGKGEFSDEFIMKLCRQLDFHGFEIHSDNLTDRSVDIVLREPHLQNASVTSSQISEDKQRSLTEFKQKIREIRNGGTRTETGSVFEQGNGDKQSKGDEQESKNPSGYSSAPPESGGSSLPTSSTK